MQYVLNGKCYSIIINRKDIKNMYLRVNENLDICVSANRFITNSTIENFIKNNTISINKMIETQKKRIIKNQKLYFLGKEKEIVVVDQLDKPLIDENKLYIKNSELINKYIKKLTIEVFTQELEKCYSLFEENIPFPILKIRKMKSKWGSCKKIDHTITLNSELIKYSIDDIDYVITHELSHFLEFNHSKTFWYYVQKYKPNYKINKKHLKE